MNVSFDMNVYYNDNHIDRLANSYILSGILGSKQTIADEVEQIRHSIVKKENRSVNIRCTVFEQYL